MYIYIGDRLIHLVKLLDEERNTIQWQFSSSHSV